MITKQFQDLAVNQEFVFGGLVYRKIEEKRISCCRAINACLVENPNTTTQIRPIEEVQVNE